MNKGCCKDCGIEFCKHKLLGVCYYECAAWLPKTTSKDNEKTTINEDKKDAVKTDMVEVVRCKDCKYGEHAKNGYNEDMISCKNPETAYMLAGWLNSPDWFCPNGENKKN